MPCAQLKRIASNESVGNSEAIASTEENRGLDDPDLSTMLGNLATVNLVHHPGLRLPITLKSRTPT